MFEKEAEERAEEETETVDDCDYDGCSRSCARDYYYFGFKDGAEYGYNKANEWHYPSKGEYPEENVECLCIDKVWTGQTFTTILKFCDGVFIDGNGTPYDVIAWKEIVPPKEEEE